MRTRTTRMRTALAVAILAALPIFTGAVQSDADPASADAAQASSGAERGSGPRWSFVLGEDNSARTACWGIGGWAEVWCRVYAL